MTSIGHPGQSSPIPPVHSAPQNRRTRRHRPGPPRHATKQIKKTCLSGWHKPESVIVSIPGPYASGMTHPSVQGCIHSAGNGGGAALPKAKECPRNAVKRVCPGMGTVALSRLPDLSDKTQPRADCIVILRGNPCIQRCWNSQLVSPLSRIGIRLDALQEAAVLLDLLQAATPIEFAFVHGDVGAAVAHAGAAVLQYVEGLDDHE